MSHDVPNKHTQMEPLNAGATKPFFLQPVSTRQVKQRQSSFFGLGGIGGNNRGNNQCNEEWAPVNRPNEQQLSHTVADYQFVFQQLKQEFPTSASGALHQMTMARISEIKANQLEEKRERDKKEEEERPLNILASKLVGLIKPVNIINTSSKQDPDNNNGGLRRSSSAWMQDPPSRGGGLLRGSTYGSRNTLLGNDSMHSLWNRQEPEDFIYRSSSVFSLMQKATALPDDQALHIRCVSLLTRRTMSTADDSSRFNINDNLHNSARRMSEDAVKEEEEAADMIGTSRRRSDISLLSDLSGLDYENVNATDHFTDLSGLFEVTDDDDNDEIINVDDHCDGKGLHSVRSETELPSSHDATSQGVDGEQDKDEEKIDLLQNDSDGNRSPTSNVTQFLGLDLSKSLPKSNEKKDTHRTTSIASDVTSSDCCSTSSSNLDGMIVGFSDQHTNYDGNDLLVGFVNRRRSESPY